MIKVFLDTSLLLEAYANKVDPFDALDEVLNEPYEPVFVDCVIEELESMPTKPEARLALKVVKLKNPRIVKGTKPCDKAILDAAESVGGIICTLDREMKSQARSLGLRVITLRNKGYLEEVQ